MTRIRRSGRSRRRIRRSVWPAVALALVVATAACAPGAASDAIDALSEELAADPRIVDARIGHGQLLPFGPRSIGFTVTVPDHDPELMRDLVMETAERIWHLREVREIGEIGGVVQTQDLEHALHLSEVLGIGDGLASATADQLEESFGPRSPRR